MTTLVVLTLHSFVLTGGLHINETPGVIGVANISDSFNSEGVLVADQGVFPSIGVACLSTTSVLVMQAIIHPHVGCHIKTL